MNSTSKFRELTDQNFKPFINNSKELVIVDFWAEYCNVCRAMEPVLAKLAKEYKNAVQILKLDTEAYPDIAAHYEVRTLPTLIFFKEGNIIGQTSGFMPKHTLSKLIDDIVGESATA